MTTILPMLMVMIMMVSFRALRFPCSTIVWLAIAITVRRRVGVILGGGLAHSAGFVVYAADYQLEKYVSANFSSLRLSASKLWAGFQTAQDLGLRTLR